MPGAVPAPFQVAWGTPRDGGFESGCKRSPERDRTCGKLLRGSHPGPSHAAARATAGAAAGGFVTLALQGFGGTGRAGRWQRHRPETGRLRAGAGPNGSGGRPSGGRYRAPKNGRFLGALTGVSRGRSGTPGERPAGRCGGVRPKRAGRELAVCRGGRKAITGRAVQAAGSPALLFSLPAAPLPGDRFAPSRRQPRCPRRRVCLPLGTAAVVRGGRPARGPFGGRGSGRRAPQRLRVARKGRWRKSSL